MGSFSFNPVVSDFTLGLVILFSFFASYATIHYAYNRQTALKIILKFISQFPLLKNLRWWSLSVWAAITDYHRLAGLNNEPLFLTVLGTRSPRLGCQYGWSIQVADC